MTPHPVGWAQPISIINQDDYIIDLPIGNLIKTFSQSRGTNSGSLSQMSLTCAKLKKQKSSKHTKLTRRVHLVE